MPNTVTLKIEQMKTKIQSLLTLTLLLTTSILFAQTTYTISPSAAWSSKLPTTCANCIINIASGATLTIDKSVTCQNCTFNGGTISMTDKTLNIQYTGSQTTTYFNNTNFQVYGNGSKVIVNAPLSLTNSTFTFNDKSNFTTSYEVDLNASRIDMYDNSLMIATGSATTPFNLINSSKIVVGSGTKTSTAAVLMSGPTVNVYDNSSIGIGNDNNIFFDWSNYNYYPSTGSATPTKSYSTSAAAGTMNCGTGYDNACASPLLYGPASLTAAGPVKITTLPVVLVGFTAELNSNKTVTLNWNTQQEVNASHFAIERSNNGSDWSDIGTVAAKGNTSMVTDYTFTDEAPAAGINYYRLKMVDLDDKYGYTQVAVVRMAALVSNVSFFPNPTHDYVNVNLAQSNGAEVTILLLNQSGQVLQEKKAAGGNTIVTLPVQQYAAGLYILSVVSSDGSRSSSKLLISRS